ncbi:hypothetical protein P43SY_004329 [Pythium insidiosum]|uniref:Uncharacterized protein n=1 Tax=Pythium insidiosum TaxID=114742 RepID=A0AAD5LY91_PYTIN|nr:hypothetical protein P43SY_004329 [Pythium insidiosum]
MADAVQSVAVGLLLGGIILAVFSRFPGEPLDIAREDDEHKPVPVSDRELEERRREVELVASQLKVDKLQQLLGLEKDKIEAMVEQAKRDAIQGRMPPAQAPSYARWLDTAFFLIIIALIYVVLRVEYRLDILQVVALAFPREAEVIRRILTLPRQLESTWKAV